MTAMGALGLACASSMSGACILPRMRKALWGNCSCSLSNGWTHQEPCIEHRVPLIQVASFKSDGPDDEKIRGLSDSVFKLGCGTITGIVAGFALKTAAVLTIGVVLGVQVAAAAGYIEFDWKDIKNYFHATYKHEGKTGHVNWTKLEEDLMTLVDPDGENDMKAGDLKKFWDGIVSADRTNIIYSVEFMVGAVLGITWSN
ncbi:Aste57867_10632 [Aphanomyces stellatus]|uniref:Aste57867_10632 protein n=1 Tax=Aphanomyces stellatus TaxID=120398 RepID=A0A485KSF8_9STRA|nr:hypothetical protein As57867_010592 [Aphanomyces stellatus]VFT87504.1 Aste57867_10632 [Aphanomyces stellatus]